MVDIGAVANEGGHYAEVSGSCSAPECCGALDHVPVELHHPLRLAVRPVLRQQAFHHLYGDGNDGDSGDCDGDFTTSS